MIMIKEREKKGKEREKFRMIMIKGGRSCMEGRGREVSE